MSAQPEFGRKMGMSLHAQDPSRSQPTGIVAGASVARQGSTGMISSSRSCATRRSPGDPRPMAGIDLGGWRHLQPGAVVPDPPLSGPPGRFPWDWASGWGIAWGVQDGTAGPVRSSPRARPEDEPDIRLDATRRILDGDLGSPPRGQTEEGPEVADTIAQVDRRRVGRHGQEGPGVPQGAPRPWIDRAMRATA